MVAASFAVGITTVVPQLLVPFAAHLAPAAERGRVVGTVMSGLLIGILLSRTAAGFVGTHLGWRAMFWVRRGADAGAGGGAAADAAGPARRWRRCPTARCCARSGGSCAEEPVLRLHSLLGRAHVRRVRRLLGHAGALPPEPARALRPADGGTLRRRGRGGRCGGAARGALCGHARGPEDQRAGHRVLLGSFVVLALLGRWLWGIALGVILLDLGAQANHISNQTRVFALRPEARSRLNTVYMVTYFAGGAAGSWLGTAAWVRFGWTGVCGVGGGLSLVGLVVLGVGWARLERAAVRREELRAGPRGASAGLALYGAGLFPPERGAPMSLPKLTYFAARGRAETARMILAEAGVEYEEVNFEPSKPGERPPSFTALIESGKLPFNQVPFWEEDGLMLAQSDAIVRHLARKYGFCGSGPRENALCDMVAEGVKDLGMEVFKLMSTPPADRPGLRAKLVEAIVPRWLGDFAKLLATAPSAHFVGSSLTYADLAVFSMSRCWRTTTWTRRSSRRIRSSRCSRRASRSARACPRTSPARSATRRSCFRARSPGHAREDLTRGTCPGAHRRRRPGRAVDGALPGAPGGEGARLENTLGHLHPPPEPAASTSEPSSCSARRARERRSSGGGACLRMWGGGPAGWRSPWRGPCSRGCPRRRERSGRSSVRVRTSTWGRSVRADPAAGRARAAGRGPVPPRAEGVDQDAERGKLRASDCSTGEDSVRADYLVAADGVRSSVCEALGIAQRGRGTLGQTSPPSSTRTCLPCGRSTRSGSRC